MWQLPRSRPPAIRLMCLWAGAAIRKGMGMEKARSRVLQGIGALLIAFIAVVVVATIPDIAAKLGKARDAEQRRAEIAVATHEARNHSEVLRFSDGASEHAVVISDEASVRALRQKGDELVVRYDPHDPEGNLWFDGKPGETLFSSSLPVCVAIFLGTGICCLVLAGKESGTPPASLGKEPRPRRAALPATSQSTDDILYL